MGVRLSRYVALGLLSLGCGAFAAPASAAPNVGYKDHTYGDVTGSITSSKPESKLWFSNGAWWADMVYQGATTPEHHIAKLDRATEKWSDTGTKLDLRATSRSDVLLDGGTGKLYVASHIFSAPGASSTNEGRLYRYTYDGKKYVKDPAWGSPAKIFTGADTETLALAKDTTGTLWATWTLNGNVYVNHTLRPDPLLPPDDKTWGTPYALPFPAVSEDDIASIIAFAGQIGVMWSNKNDGQFSFATHVDGAGDTAFDWSGGAIPGLPPRDDHISLKADTGGRVYAAVKYTTTAGPDPFVALVVRDPFTAAWTQYPVGTVSNSHTRPIVLLDDPTLPDPKIRVYMTGPEPPNISGQEGGTIYEKTSPFNPIGFPSGLGTPVVRDGANPALNDVTSTKQPITAASGVILLTNNPDTNTYWHGDVRLDGSTPPPPPPLPPPGTSGFTPVADARTELIHPASNYGWATSLTVKDGAARSYLRFSLAGLKGPVTSVTLRLKAGSTNAKGGTVYAASNNWSETAITWDNAPAPTGPALGTVGRVNPGQKDIALDPHAITGNGTYTFVLSDGESGSAVYYSRESDASPELMVTTAPPPPPPPPVVMPPPPPPPVVMPPPPAPTLTLAAARRRAASALSRRYTRQWRGGTGKRLHCSRVARNTYGCRATWRYRGRHVQARLRVALQGNVVRASRMSMRTRR